MVINLLPQLKAEEVEFLRRKKLLELLSVAALIVAAVVVIGVFAYWAILGNEAAAVNSKIEQTQAAVDELASVESLFRGLKLKLDFLDQILPARLSHSQTLEDIGRLLPEGVGFSEFLLEESGQTVISGRAISSAELGNFSEAISQTRFVGGQKIEKAVFSSIAREKTGFYKFTLKLNLKKP
jgi:Tfp pilus assembly protein PilN